MTRFNKIALRMSDKKPTYADVCKNPVNNEVKQKKQSREEKPQNEMTLDELNFSLYLERKKKDELNEAQTQRNKPTRDELNRSMYLDICCRHRDCLCHECDFMHASGETRKEWRERMQEKRALQDQKESSK
jgi:hypothetical protein